MATNRTRTCGEEREREEMAARRATSRVFFWAERERKTETDSLSADYFCCFSSFFFLAGSGVVQQKLVGQFKGPRESGSPPPNMWQLDTSAAILVAPCGMTLKGLAVSPDRDEAPEGDKVISGFQ